MATATQTTEITNYYVDRFSKLLIAGEDDIFVKELDAFLNQEIGKEAHIELLNEFRKVQIPADIFMVRDIIAANDSATLKEILIIAVKLEDVDTNKDASIKEIQSLLEGSSLIELEDAVTNLINDTISNVESGKLSKKDAARKIKAVSNMEKVLDYIDINSKFYRSVQFADRYSHFFKKML